MEKKYDIFGIENALMDIVYHLTDEQVHQLGLAKGSFVIIDDTLRAKVKALSQKPMLIPGGSATNAVVIASQLGAKCAFALKVGDDDVGKLYLEDLQKLGIKVSNAMPGSLPTGYVFTFITPDAQRTFALFLGACTQLKRSDVNFDLVAQSKIVHITGYMLETPSLRSVILDILKCAKKYNTLVSIDVADHLLVGRMKPDIVKMIDDYADIVFANEDEAKALMDADATVITLSAFAKTTILKCGINGSIVTHEGKVHKIKACRVEAVDTTGAGDSYAGAFLYALAKGHDIKKAGALGSLISSKVVEQIGARLKTIPTKEIAKIIAKAS